MVENTIYPSLDFHSSPYDPKWWLDPPSYSPIVLSDDFYDDCSHESQDKYCDFSQQFPTSQDTCEFSPTSDSTNDTCDFSKTNWYVDDLSDQLYSLQKLPSQSVKNYISKAKSLAYALNRAGEPIDEIELIDCIIDGLDDSLIGFRKYYSLMNPSLSLDLLSHILLSHEKLQDIHDNPVVDITQPMTSHPPYSQNVMQHPSLKIMPEISPNSSLCTLSISSTRRGLPPPPPSLSTPSKSNKPLQPNPLQPNPPQGCDISPTQSPPPGSKRFDDPPDQNWGCHSPPLSTSRTHINGSNLASISSTFMRSTRVATDAMLSSGPLVHYILYAHGSIFNVYATSLQDQGPQVDTQRPIHPSMHFHPHLVPSPFPDLYDIILSPITKRENLEVLDMQDSLNSTTETTLTLDMVSTLKIFSGSLNFIVKGNWRCASYLQQDYVYLRNPLDQPTSSMVSSTSSVSHKTRFVFDKGKSFLIKVQAQSASKKPLA